MKTVRKKKKKKDDVETGEGVYFLDTVSIRRARANSSGCDVRKKKFRAYITRASVPAVYGDVYNRRTRGGVGVVERYILRVINQNNPPTWRRLNVFHGPPKASPRTVLANRGRAGNEP